MSRLLSHLVLPLVTAGVCFLILNWIGRILPLRWDVTAEKIHSISEDTIAHLGNLENPVTIRLFASKSENSMPYKLRVYRDRVEYYLEVLEKSANGKLEIIYTDPLIGSEAEKTAKFNKITPNFNKAKNTFYFGISIACLDKKTSIPFLDPVREGLLEYDILQAIDTISNNNRKTVGILSTLPVFGGKYVSDRGEGDFSSWLFIRELNKTYNVVSYSENPSLLDTQRPDLLIVIHPKKIEESLAKSIDEYLASNGKLIVLLDPYSVAIETINAKLLDQLMGSNFESFLNKWNVVYSPTKVVADMLHKTEINRGFGPETSHTMLTIHREYIHKTDPITTGVNNLGFAYAGHFQPTSESIKKMVPLVTTSKDSNVIDANRFRNMNRGQNEKILREFQSDGMRRVIVTKLNGPLPHLLPTSKRTEPWPENECQVVLFGDADFIFDPFAGEAVDLSLDQQGIKAYNGNFALFSNTVDHLIGGQQLSSARNKGSVKYPLLGLGRIQAEYEKVFQEQRAEISKTTQDVERELDKHAQKTPPQENLSELIQYERVTKDLIAKREQLEEDMSIIDYKVQLALQKTKNKIQWLNAILVPVLIFLSGIFVIFRRQSRSSS